MKTIALVVAVALTLAACTPIKNTDKIFKPDLGNQIINLF